MGYSDLTPTLLDVEQTHIVFLNAHFKPFAAIGYEYNKVQVQAGSPQLGGNVTFSIAQFGDFFSDMVVHASLSAVSASAGLADLVAANGGSAPVNVAASATGFTSYRVVSYAGVELVPSATFALAQSTASVVDYVRYCDYPGQRLMKKTKFDVNGNPLDEYTSDSLVFHQKFHVAPNKSLAWDRCVGQEVPVDAWSEPLGNGTRKALQMLNGAQTPKASQPALDLWVPLIFWFNTDPRLAIPSVSIPYGQRFISVEFASQAELVYNAPGAYLEKTVVADAGGAGSDMSATTGRSTVVTKVPLQGNGALSAQSLDKLELYVNNIFVNPEIHSIYIKRIGFTLVRVHRTQVVNTNVNEKETLLSQLKYPIETIYAGLRPVANKSSPTNWHKFTRNVQNSLAPKMQSKSLVYTGITTTVTPLLNLANVGAWAPETSAVDDVKSYWMDESRVASTVNVVAHGIPIYMVLNQEFFNQYMPYTYGGFNVNCPKDKGIWMINFSLYPGTYQPSGHLNVSRAREFYLNYVGDAGAIDSLNPADLVVDAKAINFLLISDGSAVLRYNT